MSSLTGKFLQIYDACLEKETNPSRLTNYTLSRPKFETLLPIMNREPYDSLLEIGISEFSSVMHAVCPEKRIAGLGLHMPELGWGNPKGLQMVEGDLTCLPPIPSLGQFDLVLCSEVIEHVQGNPIGAYAALRPFVRPGGRLIVTTPNLARLFNRVKLLLGRTPLELIHTVPWAGHFREYTRAEVVSHLTRAGFTVEKAEYSLYWDGVPFYLSGGDRGYDERGRWYYRPRYRGWRRVAALPLLWVMEILVKRFPSLRNGMIFVARPS